MLYDAIDGLGEGRNWWALWLEFVTRYHRMGQHTPAQLSAVSNLYKHFQAATMDFIHLMNIDFADSMRCRCEQPFQHLSADGITVSCQTRNLCMAAPFAAKPDDTNLVWGSRFGERIYVVDPAARKLLSKFSSTSATAGLCPDEYAQLQTSLTVSKLLDLLTVVQHATRTEGDAATTKCKGWARLFLHSLSSDTPACVMIRPAQMERVEHFIANRTWGTAQDDKDAMLSLPGIWDVCVQAQASSSSSPDFTDSVVKVLEELLQVFHPMRP